MNCNCPQHTKARPLFGKIGRISIVGPNGPCTDRVLDSALNVVDRFEETIRRDYMGSELMTLCNAEVGTYVPVSEWFWRLLQLANDISYRTDGLFDVAAAGTDGVARWTDIDLSRPSAVRLRRKLFLSLGGIAKGFAVDLAIKALKETGVRAGLVDIGGCIRAFGPREWRVEYSPCQGHGKIGSAVPVPVRNDALAGCGSYFGGARLMDLERGVTLSALEWGDMNVLVRAKSCAVADALTKVAAIRPECSDKILKQFGAEATVLSAFGAERLNYAS